MRHTATFVAGLQGRTPIEAITGETPDISQLLDFGWCDWVWFKENAGSDVPHLGRFLGTAHSSSDLMTHCVLPVSGMPVLAGTVQQVTKLEKQTKANQQRMRDYNDKMSNKFKEKHLVAESGKPTLEDWADSSDDDDDFAAEFNRSFDNADVTKADDDFDPDSHNGYLDMELTIDQGGEHPDFCRVTKCLKDHQGNPIGTSNKNPTLDTRMCEVEFLNGHKQAMSANVIAENVFASINEEGH